MSLFAHLAVRFGTHPENLATEALGFILRRSAAARSAVRDLVRQLGVELPEELAYQNQASGDDDARPDVVGVTPDGKAPFIIEAKFWAGLTEAQPLAYLDRLPAAEGVLAVIVPRARMELIWHELLRRCEGAGRPVQIENCSIGDVRLGRVGTARLALVSWSALLDVIGHRLDAANEVDAREDLHQLRGLCERMDAEAFLPLQANELSSKDWRRIIEFGGVVDDVTATLTAMKLVSLKGCRATAGNGYYGRYAWLRGVGVFLIADVRKWMKFASTPLWLSVYGSRWRGSNPAAARKALAALEVSTPPRMFVAGDGYPTVPLFLPVGVERVRVVEEVVRQVEAVSLMIDSLAESVTAPPVAPPSEDGTVG
jgi:hypothetical protein